MDVVDPKFVPLELEFLQWLLENLPRGDLRVRCEQPCRPGIFGRGVFVVRSPDDDASPVVDRVTLVARERHPVSRLEGGRLLAVLAEQ